MIDYQVHWQSWRTPPCRPRYRITGGAATWRTPDVTCTACQRLIAVAERDRDLKKRRAWVQAHPWLADAALAQGFLPPTEEDRHPVAPDMGRLIDG